MNVRVNVKHTLLLLSKNPDFHTSGIRIWIASMALNQAISSPSGMLLSQGAYIRQVGEYPPPPSVPNIGHGVLARVTTSGRSYQAAIVEST